ncbi:MAG: efflux RND transporter periplasmic adaptor subunit [Nitrospirota bacterium]
MKKKELIITAGLMILLIILFYLSKPGLIGDISKRETSREVKAQQPVRGHAEVETAQGRASKEQTAGEEISTIEIPPEKQQLIGVKTTEVSVKPLQKIIRTVGRIEYDERKVTTVNIKFEGWIEKLYVDYSGRYVKKGEPLAEIYSPELFATQQEFINLLRWMKQSKNNNLNTMLTKDAEAIVEATKQRLRLWDITDEQIKEIEKIGRPIRTLTIYSPLSGYVLEKMALQGMRVMAGEKLFDIVDLSTVWIISDIYEYEMPLVNVEQRAKISLSYFPDREFSSKIDYIYPALSGETRTAKVRFTIANPGLKLKPEMFTNVEVKVNLGKRLLIPVDSVIDTGTRQIVYVDKGEGYFEPREVALGLRGEGMVEVTKGLKAKERVASSATFLIDSEAKLKGVVPLHMQ